jgi:hypothetical protein
LPYSSCFTSFSKPNRSGTWKLALIDAERYAIVSRSDMNDAILKLQESQKRVEQERIQREQQSQIKARIGHNDEMSSPSTASRAVH